MFKMSGASIGLLFAALGAVGFSFKAILVKLAYRYGVDAETLLALRMGLALPFFVVMGVIADCRATSRLSGRDALWFIGLGFFGYYLSSYLDFVGLSYISAGLERLILFTYPTIVIVLSAIFLKNPVTQRMVIALALCYGGIVIAVGHDLRIASDVSATVLGCVLVFGSAVSYALYMMGNGIIVGRLGSMRVTALATTVACLFCLAHFFVLRPLSALVQPWQVYGLALLMALLSTVAPVWLVSEGIRRSGAGPVSLMSSLGPVVTMGLGWWLLDEEMGAMPLIGAAMVIAGVLFMAKRPRPPRAGGAPAG